MAATWLSACLAFAALGAGGQVLRPRDPAQSLERTAFQTSQPWSGATDLQSDVAIVYGIGTNLPARLKTWRDHGYVTHVMTGVAWGRYPDYLNGSFDGIAHQDQAQTDANGNPHLHGGGGGIFYMSPTTNYGNYLCVSVRRALEAGAQAIHLEEPEFWVQDGYEESFKREWRNYFGEEWQPPHSSVDAQWRASKLKYYLYRRTLQQVFDSVQAYNRATGHQVRCYVPTHSLLNYAHWRIVSPESSLAQLAGCDGYIAQVWTGTARTPNLYRGELRERTFETAFLEYGAMQNLVLSTGRRVWYLNDPVEDNPDHDWHDYRINWESTLVASLFQPEVWRYEVAPWPERVFAGRYPRRRADREPIPPEYATELQVVMNALNDMNQKRIEWDCGTPGIGVMVSDSLMFERGPPAASDPHMSHFYGLALPLLKRGMPVTPVQLENLHIPHYLDPFHLLLLTYQGMKPLNPEAHRPLAEWVKRGGALIVCDADQDPFNQVREWWNQDGRAYATPRQHLFEQLGLKTALSNTLIPVGKGCVFWLREDPSSLAASAEGNSQLVSVAHQAAVHCRLPWSETSYLLLRRGPYVIAAGLDESFQASPPELRGTYISLFDPQLRLTNSVTISPGSRYLLLDLSFKPASGPQVIASSCKTWLAKHNSRSLSLFVEGVSNTPGLVVIRGLAHVPSRVLLDGERVDDNALSFADGLLHIRFTNQSLPRMLAVEF